MKLSQNSKTDTTELCRKKKHVACTLSAPSAQYFCVTSRRVCNSQVGLNSNGRRQRGCRIRHTLT